MKNTPQYREAAQRVLDYIEQHPQNHNQDTWWNVPNEGNYLDSNGNYDAKAIEANICDTTMCVAGTAVFLEHGAAALVNPWATINTNYSTAGADILGLDDEEADWLFYETNESEAVDALRALSNGDEYKFKELMRSTGLTDSE